MKKKILIVSHAMELGGAERSLLGLLETIDFSRYDIDLFLLRHEGELLSSIPKKVHLLPQISAYTVLARSLKKVVKERHFLLAAARIYGKIRAVFFDKKNNYDESIVALEYSHKYTYKLMPQIQPDQNYDVAISFLTPHYIVTNNVYAKKKIAWIHTDYSQIQLDVASEKKMWETYDYIISISKAVTEGFIEIFPSLKNRVILIENILPTKLILKQAEKQDISKEMPKKGIRVLSIGRYCKAKNFDNVPVICRKLCEKGMDVYWYIIGFGEDEELVRRKITENAMEERVILLGKRENPYPYIRACDLYVQPSRYEGKSVAVREAQLLRKPVLITNYPTAKSQVEDGIDGIIAPLDNEKCAAEIKRVLDNKELMDQLAQNCGKRDYSNSQEIKKIYQLIETGHYMPF